jgi:hypothetical protein
MATSGDILLATREDFFMATDSKFSAEPPRLGLEQCTHGPV